MGGDVPFKQDTPHIVKGALKKKQPPADLFNTIDFIDPTTSRNDKYNTNALDRHEALDAVGLPYDRQNIYLRNWVINNIKGSSDTALQSHTLDSDTKPSLNASSQPYSDTPYRSAQPNEPQTVAHKQVSFNSNNIDGQTSPLEASWRTPKNSSPVKSLIKLKPTAL